MDAFLAKLSYHATSYAIRSCLALTSTYVAKHASSLLKTVDDGPLRRQFDQLQRRLARKIELISPVLESIELRYAQGETALEAIIKISRELREDIDSLEDRILVAVPAGQVGPDSSNAGHASGRCDVLAIIDDIKELIANIDDAIPLVNLWVSTLGGLQIQPTPFSASRLLQASMLLNVADTQYILSPHEPMQIGPDFSVSLYMLFRGHASLSEGEQPYGIEEGQRKPLWQQVMRKARVRLYRVPYPQDPSRGHKSVTVVTPIYKYHLQVVEDLDDGLLHTADEDEAVSCSFDGVESAGVRETVAIADVSKLLYTEVGSLLNIASDDGARSSPVLLIKRDVQASVAPEAEFIDHRLPEERNDPMACCTKTSASVTIQDEIDQQLFGETDLAVQSCGTYPDDIAPSQPKGGHQRTLPSNLDPEWMAMEVYVPEEYFEYPSDESQDTIDLDNAHDASDSSDSSATDSHRDRLDSLKQITPSGRILDEVDPNLCSQFSRMGLRNGNARGRPAEIHHKNDSSASSGQLDLLDDDYLTANPAHSHCPVREHLTTAASKPSKNTNKNNNVHSNNDDQHHDQHPPPEDKLLLRRSPFGAIRTSLSLLEMLLRLTSLQEFEQKTHLAIPDHVLRFYLDESASTSGLRGQQRWQAKREAEAKMGFDPYTDDAGAAGIGAAAAAMGVMR